MLEEILYDDSFEGFLCAIYYSYNLSDFIIIKESKYELTLVSNPTYIKTDLDIFRKVYNSIRDKLSYNTLKKIYYLYLSEKDNIENLILNYIKLCYKFGDDINLAKNNDTIFLVDKYFRQVYIEVHRFLGLVRFNKFGDIYYSKIEPTFNILSLIQSHFIERFSNQNFIIHDLKRNLALIHNKEEAVIVSDFKMDSSLINFNDNNFDNLWKTYFNSTNIKERFNPRLQKQFMPTRYWDNLPEIQK